MTNREREIRLDEQEKVLTEFVSPEFLAEVENVTTERIQRERLEQMEFDCKAVCQFCRRRMIVESTSKGYVHPSGGAFHHCAASEIRAANRERAK